MNVAKYITLGIWAIYWLLFFLIKKTNSQIQPIIQKETIDPSSKKPLIWVIVLHFALYSFLWTEIGGLKDIPVLSVSLYPLAFATGIIMLMFGVMFSIIARYYLGSSWSLLTITSINRPFIKNGPYQFVRHPIYLGLFTIWLGVSLLFFNWIGIVSTFVVLLPLLYHRAKIEEDNLIKTFGANYQSHINETGLLFPRIF